MNGPTLFHLVEQTDLSLESDKIEGTKTPKGRPEKHAQAKRDLAASHEPKGNPTDNPEAYEGKTITHDTLVERGEAREAKEDKVKKGASIEASQRKKGDVPQAFLAHPPQSWRKHADKTGREKKGQQATKPPAAEKPATRKATLEAEGWPKELLDWAALTEGRVCVRTTSVCSSRSS